MGDCNGDFISVSLENLDEYEVSTQFAIALKDKSNAKNFCQRRSIGVSIFGEKKFWGWSHFAKKESILSRHNGCLMNDTLNVSCDIYATNVTGRTNSESNKEDCSEASLKHFEMLFNTGNFSDVTIKVGNEELRVHKVIVTSLSPVFLAMFENKMKEQNENIVEIVDIEFDVMKEMFRYMYTRKVNKIEKIAGDLFIAADKYCVKGLERLCEKSLCQDLEMDNALERLEMAVKYNGKKLKESTLKFIAGNLKIFNGKKEFKELNSECKSELLCYIAEKFELHPMND